MFLRRNDYVLHIFFNAYQRAGFYIVIAAVRNKIFYRLPGLRIELNFVKDYDRLSWIKGNTGQSLKPQKENVQLGYVLERGKQVVRYMRKVDFDVGAIVFFCKLLRSFFKIFYAKKRSFFKNFYTKNCSFFKNFTPSRRDKTFFYITPPHPGIARRLFAVAARGKVDADFCAGVFGAVD